MIGVDEARMLVWLLAGFIRFTVQLQGSGLEVCEGCLGFQGCKARTRRVYGDLMITYPKPYSEL